MKSSVEVVKSPRFDCFNCFGVLCLDRQAMVAVKKMFHLVVFC